MFYESGGLKNKNSIKHNKHERTSTDTEINNLKDPAERWPLLSPGCSDILTAVIHMAVLTLEHGGGVPLPFPCPITQGPKSVWTCPLQRLSALQRLLSPIKRNTLPSSFTLQGSCGRMQQFALLSSAQIWIKFLGIPALCNESKRFQTCWQSREPSVSSEV